MPFACQNNSFLRNLDAHVISCTPAELPAGSGNGEKCYAVICNDTALFPEGGGQPDDRGTFNDIPVLRVLRQGNEAVHYVQRPFEVGANVHQVVDWNRRFDHMQQHSGQHILSAVLEKNYGFKTTSWWLGEKNCFIEINDKLSTSDLEKLEYTINGLIVDNIPVSVDVYAPDDPLSQKAKSRGLPEDWTGPIRVVKIDGIDENTCCGTHVSSLGQLQVLKIFYCEKGKKGKYNIFFNVGQRILNGYSDCLKRESEMTSLMKGSPDEHCSLVAKLKINYSSTVKKLSSLLKELAKIEVNYVHKDASLPYLYIYRREGNGEYANAFFREISTRPNFVICIIVGDSADNGMVFIEGPSDKITVLGNRICECMAGKGAGKGTRFQGKVTQFSAINNIETILKDVCC